MIGLAMVSMVLVVGTSIKDTFAAQLERSITADFIVTTDSFTPFSPELARQLQRTARDLSRQRRAGRAVPSRRVY